MFRLREFRAILARMGPVAGCLEVEGDVGS